MQPENSNIFLPDWPKSLCQALPQGQDCTHTIFARALALAPVGSCLMTPQGEALLQLVGRTWQSSPEKPDSFGPWPQLCALQNLACGLHNVHLQKQGVSLATITLSDKGYAGQREDSSGPHIHQIVAQALPLTLARHFLLPDEPQQLAALVLELCQGQGYDLLITTGGTGLSPRDLSPEALLPLLTRRLPGFEQAMTMAGLQKTPRAILSRCLAGCLGKSLVLALPGSSKAVQENLEAVLPSLSHALEKLAGDPSDCGRF